MSDTALSRSAVAAAIDDLRLSERDRAILKRRLCDCVLYKQLAIEFGLSEQRVKAIVYKSQNILFKYIDDTK